MLFGLPGQLKNYIEFCRISKSATDTCLDLKKLGYIYPTTLLPLLVKHPCQNLEIIPEGDCASYLKFMANQKGAETKCDLSYFPPIFLPKDNAEYSPTIKKLYEFHNDGKEYGGEKAFKLTIGELADNIYQHSNFEKAMVFAQKYPHKKFVEICIMDNGIGILNALKAYGAIFSSDAQAIFYATKGLSSKSEQERGRGIRGCISMYCRSANATMLIVSGTGAVFIDKSLKPNLFKFPDNYNLQGTLISFRIPYPCKEVDIYASGILE